MKQARLLTTVLAALVFAAYSPAPIRDIPSDFKPTAEQSQDEVARQQRLQKTVGEVGYVPRDTDEIVGSSEHNDADASKVLTRVEHEKNAAATVATAGEQMKGGGGGFPFYIWGIVVLLLGFGLMFGLRRWASQNLPQMPEQKKVTW